MRFCPNCGMKLGIHEEYCPNCGERVEINELDPSTKTPKKNANENPLILKDPPFIPPPGNPKSKDENNPSSIDSHDLKPIYPNRKKMSRYF